MLMYTIFIEYDTDFSVSKKDRRERDGDEGEGEGKRTNEHTNRTHEPNEGIERGSEYPPDWIELDIKS